MNLQHMIDNYNTEDLLNAILLISVDKEEALTDCRIPASEWLAANVIRQNNTARRTFTTSSYEELRQTATTVFIPAIDEIISKILKSVNESDDIKQDILKSTSMKLKNLSFRGDGYQFQLMDVAEKFYQPFDEDLKNTYGFSFSTCQKVIMFIYKAYMNILLTSEETANRIAIIQSHGFKILKEILYQKFDKDEIDSLLLYLSIIPGDSNLKAVSTNDFNPLYAKPFVDFGNYIYMPIPVSTILNLPKIFHYTFIAERKFVQDVVDRYTENRGSVVEALAKQYFLRLFDVVHLSLKYPKNSKTFEADITAQSDNATIFAEAKGKLLTIPALKGDLDSIEDDVYKAIGKAYEQSIRTIDHLNSDGRFIDIDGNELTLKNTTWKFPCSIMMENFTSIPSEIYNYLELSKNQLIPYAVNIYDLDIVTRECNSQEDFVQYMIFRQMNIEKLSAMDELDFFGYFKQYGLSKINLEADEVWATSYTEEFDKKYYKLTMQWLLNYKI
jgi:hypothetical protein